MTTYAHRPIEYMKVILVATDKLLIKNGENLAGKTGSTDVAAG